jgi:agmatine deiminase
MSASLTPAAAGFHMPAEWAAHERCFMAFPCRTELWGAGLPDARAAYATVAHAVGEFEPVVMLVRPEDRAAAAKLLSRAVELWEMPLNDSWARDFCPTFVANGEGAVAGVSWQFNCWGENFPDYADDATVAGRVLERLGARRFQAPFVLEGGAIHVDGEGTVLTTEECLLHPNRNPTLSRAEIEANLKAWLGVETVLWLGRGYEGDDTNGHIDEIACFAAPGVVLATECSDKDDANFTVFGENFRRLADMRDAQGRRLTVMPLPQPRRRDLNGLRLTLSYTNFFIANGGIVMSGFDDPADDHARGVMQEAFPTYKILQRPALPITAGGGGIHCITQQQPSGGIAR